MSGMRAMSRQMAAAALISPIEKPKRRQAEAALGSGITVRQLLRRFGVKAGPEWDAASERRAFLRTLHREVRRARKSV